MTTISMHSASAPRFIHGLRNLSGLLTKAQAHADARKIGHEVLLNARLYPDMFPLVRQVQIASDNAKGPVARLAGVDVPRFEDTETTFDDLQNRIARTISFIETVDASAFNGSEDRDIVLKLGARGDVHFKGLQYLCGFALPNFYFHVTTAYAILRHNGVEIGKGDFLGGM